MVSVSTSTSLAQGQTEIIGHYGLYGNIRILQPTSSLLETPDPWALGFRVSEHVASYNVFGKGGGGVN